MSYSMRVTHSAHISGEKTVSLDTTHTGTNKVLLDVSVADSVTDEQHEIAIDVSALQAIYIFSDQDITIETNDGTTPQETINVTANEPVIWETGDSALFSGDVTDFYISNSSGDTANVRVGVIQN